MRAHRLLRSIRLQIATNRLPEMAVAADLARVGNQHEKRYRAARQRIDQPHSSYAWMLLHDYSFGEYRSSQFNWAPRSPPLERSRSSTLRRRVVRIFAEVAANCASRARSASMMSSNRIASPPGLLRSSGAASTTQASDAQEARIARFVKREIGIVSDF